MTGGVYIRRASIFFINILALKVKNITISYLFSAGIWLYRRIIIRRYGPFLSGTNSTKDFHEYREIIH